jgi:hypothetical protein
MFSVRYENHLGELCLAGWDIITMPQPQCGLLKPSIYIIQVKTNNFPDSKYMNVLKEFEVPFFVIKELHLWEDRKKEPIIICL